MDGRIRNRDKKPWTLYWRRWPPVEVILYNREIKSRVYGKRERQKLPSDHDFPAIFHVCRFQREENCFRVRQQRIYRAFFKSFYHIYRPMFRPNAVLFYILCKIIG